MTYTPVQPHPGQPAFVKPPSNGLATAALVLGIIGTVLSFIPFVGGFGAFIGGVGIALAIAGFVVAGKRGVGKGKSIAGFILGVASIIIFFVVTALTVAAVDSAVKEIDKEIQKAEKAAEKAGNDTAADGGEYVEENDRPKAVKEGGAFSHDGYEVSAGWTVTNEEVLDMVGIEGMSVKNVSHGSVDTPMFTFQFVGKGETVLATVDCTGSEVAPGQSAKMDCLGLDSFPTGYQEIRVADLW
jgi:hypothetical protein